MTASGGLRVQHVPVQSEGVLHVHLTRAVARGAGALQRVFEVTQRFFGLAEQVEHPCASAV